VLDYALFLLGQPRVTTVSASTYDLLAAAGFGDADVSDKTGGAGGFDVEDLATAFMRLDDGGTLLVEASWAAHRSDGDQFGITLYGTEGGAELIVDDYEPIGSLRIFTDDAGVPAETRLTAPPGVGHRELQRSPRPGRAVHGGHHPWPVHPLRIRPWPIGPDHVLLVVHDATSSAPTTRSSAPASSTTSVSVAGAATTATRVRPCTPVSSTARRTVASRASSIAARPSSGSPGSPAHSVTASRCASRRSASCSAQSSAE
jgi:hypothetical protein